MVTLIKNGLVCDGTGEPPVPRDIVVVNGVISRFGRFSPKRADQTIDATGALVTPGFIDVGNYSDHYLTLFSEPEQRDAVRQGITTIIGGSGGISLAPLCGAPLHAAAEWGHAVRLTANWQTIGEFLATIARLRLGVNFGTLVGHTTIRRTIAPGDARDLSDGEMRSMVHTIKTALAEGALGVSLDTEWCARTSIPRHETRALAAASAVVDRIYAPSVRDVRESLTGVLGSILDDVRATHANVHVAHCMPQVGASHDYQSALALLEHSLSESVVYIDAHPFNCIERPLAAFLPPWMRTEDFLTSDSAALARCAEWIRTTIPRSEAREVHIGHAFDPALRFLEGKKIESFAESAGISCHRAIIRLMKITRLHATLVMRNVDMKLLADAIARRHTLIATHAPSVPAGDYTDERGRETFSAFLRLADQDERVGLPGAVARVTSVPAALYHIHKRGMLREGYRADIVVLRDLKPVDVLVNGVPVLLGGACTGARPGNVVRPCHT